MSPDGQELLFASVELINEGFSLALAADGRGVLGRERWPPLRRQLWLMPAPQLCTDRRANWECGGTLRSLLANAPGT